MFQSQTQNDNQPNADKELIYQPPTDLVDDVYNAEGEIRPHWKYLLDSLRSLGSAALEDRSQKALRILRDDGATYNIYGEESTPSRTWELDLVPAMVSSEEWQTVESGLLERSELFNLLLKDIYGSRDLIRHGVIPPEALFSHAGFLRACQGISMPGEQELILHAVDMVRLADGEMCVLTDRTQCPSGMGYALENRTVMSRVLPSLFRDSQVHRLAIFFQRLRNKLSSLSTIHEQPRIVVLTPGVHNETYFEHAYLANYLGFPLVQSGDLVVRNGFVWMKSLDGLNRVDVIFRRVDDWFCDPVELRSDSHLGVPNLLEVVRTGRVVIANPLGSGILENPVFLKYLPAIGKALLGRKPRLRSVPTFWCGDPDDLAYVLLHAKELVIKTIHRRSGHCSQLVNALPQKEVETLLAAIKANPWQYVAQPYLVAGHLPTFDKGRLSPRPGILRSFAVACDSDSYAVMPGGLTRVGTQEGAFLISGQVGSLSKDTWVIASEPERNKSLSEVAAKPSDAQLISLPSRVVENLFWMGRYAERAEASLRILRTVFVLLNGEEPISDSARKYLLEAVTEVTSTHPGFIECSEEMLNDPEEELLLVARDASRLGSVCSNLNAMLRCADESKELLSSDTLRVINDIRDALATLAQSLQGGLASAPEEALDPLVTALMALAGLAHESMMRGIGWQFMEIGRRIERGIQTISILEHLLTQVVSETDQTTLSEALLLSVEALISYRRRYRARMGVRQVLELVMLDTTNPRSLVYQFQQLSKQVTNLPRAKSNSNELSAEERTVLEGETTIRLTNLTKLCEEEDDSRPKLAAALDRLNQLLSEISMVVSDKYFDHRVGPQQLVHRTWES